MKAASQKSRAKYWLLFILSFTAFVLLILFAPQFFWLSLPTTVGGFALAMDWI